MAMTDLADPGQRTSQPRLGVRGWLRWSWRLLTSMRTAIILLLVLIIAAIPGSVFPQRVADPLAVNRFLADNATIGPVLDELGMFDVYGTVWFAAIYVLLFISLVGCLVPRSVELVRQWVGGPTRPPGRLASHPQAVSVPTSDPDRDMDVLAAQLTRERWRINRDPDGEWLSAEKGFLREVGNLGFHMSMLALLIAVGVGSLWGWRGNVVLREDTGFSNTLTQYDNWGGGHMVQPEDLQPFSVSLEDFSVDFERGEAQRGAPRDFRADVVVTQSLEDAGEPAVLRVNEPLVVPGAKVFLIGHGYAPHVVVTQADDTVIFDDTVVFLPRDANFTSTGVVKMPDAEPPLALSAIFAPTALLDEQGPRSTFPAPDLPAMFISAFEGDLGLDDGQAQNVYELDTTDLTQVGLEALTPGQVWTLDDGTTVEFVGFERWISVQVSQDPGRYWALVAAGLIMVGLIVSLLLPRRRIWVRRAADGPLGARLILVGLARSESARPQEEVDELVSLVSAAQERGNGGDRIATGHHGDHREAQEVASDGR